MNHAQHLRFRPWLARVGAWRSAVRRVVSRSGRLMAVGAMLCACSSDSGLKPFSSDGCSLFPDSSLITQRDWCACCFEHDLVYWRGGTYDERAAADARLKSCVLEKTGNAALASLMYEGVRIGGSPYFYNWYRWGYGWGYDRKYQALTPEEQELADKLVQEFFDSAKTPVCARSASALTDAGQRYIGREH